MAESSVDELVMGKSGRWLHIGMMCAAIFSFAFSVNAVAAVTQDIYPNPLVVGTVPNGAVSLDVMYDVGDADPTLTGIGIRVHFDSSKLSFDMVDGTLAFGRLFDPTLVSSDVDSKDFDGDAATDRFVSLAWVDFGGSWPGSLPEKLAVVHFVAAGDFAGSTTVRFSASDLAAGYEFLPTPATVNEAILHVLTVTKSGTGSGTVTSSPAGIDCGGDCSEAYVEDTQVNLTATASAGSQFVGWEGACTGTESTIKVTMDTARTCDAVFELDTWELVIIKSGNGLGTVTSNPPGIDCGLDCTETYNEGSQVNLTASPGEGSEFVGWGDACAGTTSSVKVTMDSDKSCDAIFTLFTWELTISTSGTGTGTVTSSPSGIDCGDDCSEIYNHGTLVDLIATPDAGSQFASWAGACAGNTSPVNVTMDASKICEAVFNIIPITWELSVTKSGTGSGSVTSSLSGIDCGSDCSETYNDGTHVQLIATPDADSKFVNWGGACTGSVSPFAVTMDANKTCDAEFALVLVQEIYPNSLEMSVLPNGSVALEVMYDTSHVDANLTGIGIRVHYDSSKLSFDQVNETLALGRQFDPALVVSEEDSSDHDSDVLTDRFISLLWQDSESGWPGSLPEKLAAVHFIAASDFASSTVVRFSSSDLAADYEFSSQSMTIQSDIIFADSFE